MMQRRNFRFNIKFKYSKIIKMQIVRLLSTFYKYILFYYIIFYIILILEKYKSIVFLIILFIFLTKINENTSFTFKIFEFSLGIYSFILNVYFCYFSEIWLKFNNAILCEKLLLKSLLLFFCF